MASANEQGESKPTILDADELIDEILAKKGPQKYAHGLSEDNWEEELEQIPLFMTKAPETVDAEKAPALAALQDLKYELETPEGRATAHKEDGNELFRKRQYKGAIKEYSKGISERSKDSELNAILYCNRAAAQFHLGNYRSAIGDATQANKLKHGHMKAIIRGAEANFKLCKFAETMQWCDEGLEVDHGCTKLNDLRSKAVRERKKQERDVRKKQADERKLRKGQQELVDAIESRGIRLAASQEQATRRSWKTEEEEKSEQVVDVVSLLRLEGPHPQTQCVRLDEAGRLVWPVMFLYPQYGQSDLIESFSEEDRFSDHVEVMFSHESPPPWDSAGEYTPAGIEIYYEDYKVCGEYVKVLKSATLADILNHSKRYTVVRGTPSFLILAQNDFRYQFLYKTS